MAHAALGLAGGAIVLEAMLLGYAKAPFACSYVPGAAGGMGFLPIFGFAFLGGAAMFANVELAIISGRFVAPGLVTIAIVFAALRFASRRQPEASIEFDEAPASYQQLGLHT
jgi:hypothetical protein